MMNDFVHAIGKTVKGFRAVYKNNETGEIKITAEYSASVLNMVMEEIEATKKYTFCKMIKG